MQYASLLDQFQQDMSNKGNKKDHNKVKKLQKDEVYI